jgi:hypothetical protein
LEERKKHLKIVTGKTNYLDEQSPFERQYLMEPVRSEPDCNRIDCPVLTEKLFSRDTDGVHEMVPYCEMYSRYLTGKEDGVIKPCPQCLRERRSLWES